VGKINLDQEVPFPKGLERRGKKTEEDLLIDALTKGRRDVDEVEM
jgi:hypothetical protein